MEQLKIAIIREDKVPVDRRVPLTPRQAKCVQQRFSEIKVICQSSHTRCFTDQDYIDEGIEVRDDIADCDIMMGVKEVPVDKLIEHKTYLFFSHTIKKQLHNRTLLQTILKKNIRLIDYECMVNQQGKRIVAFGRFAGIVGAYNALYTYGKKYGLYDLRRAFSCFDLQEMQDELSKIALPAVKIALTGGGRVAQGAMEILDFAGVKKVAPERYLQEQFDFPVYTQLNVTDYYRKVDGDCFKKSDVYKHPELFESHFLPFAQQSQILIVGAYWDYRAPVLFTSEEMKRNNFAIQVIADITCDIEGAVPSTKKASTIAEPIYDYKPATETVQEPPFADRSDISVMAVDNLPSELPRDASEAFGNKLLERIVPALLVCDQEGIIKRATIAQCGKLTAPFIYLEEYVQGK